MWWKFAVFLLLCIKCVTSQEISCEYREAPGSMYTCFLTINNPNGSDDFTSIPGEHLPNRTDADVRTVDSFDQNTLNVPSIICRQFPNLVDLYMAINQIEIIDENSFVSCSNLRSITLAFNSIRRIPPNTFRFNPRLEHFYLFFNEISEISPDSFTGSAANHIDLTLNKLGDMPGGALRGSWFNSVASTLQSLGLMANNFTGIEVNAFLNLDQLLWLDLSVNPFGNLTDSSFNGLVNIIDLYLIACDLGEIRAAWFNDMRFLSHLHLELNQLVSLPDGAFEQLESLSYIFLAYNNLTTLELAPFGETAFNIEHLGISNNRIFSIQPELFDKMENVDSIEMIGNVCNQNVHSNIQENPFLIRARLRRCFDNFGPRFAECEYLPIDGEYACLFHIRNAEGLDFDRIDGTHLSERFDEDVRTVYGSYQNSLIFPPVVCRQFRGVETIFFYSNYVEIISEESFENCRSLRFLNLDFNSIRHIPDNTFRNSPNLEVALFAENLIQQVDPLAFAGTAIDELDLGLNDLVIFNPAVYEAINTTLRSLTLTKNRIGFMPNNAFANLANVEIFILSDNQLLNVPAETFDGALNLTYLALAHCGLTSLHPEWFRNKERLETIYIGSNPLTELQDGIFDALPSLQQVYIYNTRIRELRASHFGNSLNSLSLIYAIASEINSIDSEIVNQAPNMEFLFLLNNFCVDTNFYDVNANPQQVLERIETCSSNFQATPTLSCDYTMAAETYRCQATILNPLGIEFERVDGEHIAGSGDGDVSAVEIRDQNTFAVPNVICTQFNNLRRFYIFSSLTFSLTSDAFANCHSLTDVLIMGNNIHMLSPIFQNSPNLITLILPSNRLNFVNSFAFEGTSVINLDLERNEISTWDAMWFQPIETTIRVLVMNDNLITEIENDAFVRLWNIVTLVLSNNPLRTLRYRAFQPLVSLENLFLANCGITELDPNYFIPLVNLVRLELDGNELRDLPVGVFNVPRLIHLGLASNQLRAIDSLSFGASLNTLRSLHVDMNNIEVIDEVFFDNATDLFALVAYQNECADFTAIEIPTNRENVRELFSPCFRAFNELAATCEFEFFEGMYKCNLDINNPQGKHRFQRVFGDHIGSYNDNSVTYIEAINQNTKTIPEIVCSQFRFVEGISFIRSQLEFIPEHTFAGCEYLFSLNLDGNNIRIIPPVTFRQNSYLSSLRLDGNRIASLPVDLFAGTQIYDLHLSNNQIENISHQLFAPIAHNLIFLDLSLNRIRILPRNAFIGMTMLYELNLDGNSLGSIPSDAFHSMPYVGFLSISNCGLSTLLPRHFQEKPILYRLEVNNNRLTYLSPNVFNIPSLETIGLDGNQLDRLESISFGASLGSLTAISATRNEIFGIDELMISRVINSFNLMDNVCTNINFINIQTNRQNVFDALETCFLNFRRINDALRCDYSQQNEDYVCSMTLVNEDGHTLFESVDGEHLVGRTDEDVVRIEALNQNARSIPPVVCQQFPNTRDFIITNSNVRQLSAATFSGCRNLNYLNMNFNELTFLPARIFPASLTVLSLYRNRIRDVSFQAFEGSSIEVLDLNLNLLDLTLVEIFFPINETLTDLFLEYNYLTYFPPAGLENLRNVRFLDVSGNDLSAPGSIPSNAFAGGENMDIFSLTDAGLTYLDREWFVSMPNLSVIYLYNNRISVLPFDIFGPLTNINSLHLSTNQIMELRVSSFRNSLRGLWYFYVSQNQLDGIQNEILDELQSAQWLMLTENNCIDRNFIDVVNNNEMIRTELSGCISNFRSNSISCEYFGDETEYLCLLDVHNPDGDEFERIEGEHVEGLTNNEVTSVNGFYRNTRTVPSVICRQFPNLHQLILYASGVEEIFPSSLKNCENLAHLLLENNRIRRIGSETFINVPNLSVLSVAWNQVMEIEERAFQGTSLEILDLFDNRLTHLRTGFLAEVGATLTMVDLSFNQISQVPELAFSNLTNLHHLIMTSNRMEGNIAGNAFEGLFNLMSLGLANTVTRVLNPSWFTDLVNLRELYLNNNILREITSDALAPSLTSLDTIYLQNNYITKIDQTILDEILTPNLNYLSLSGNLCVDDNFLNLQQTRWRIFEALSVCTNNFYLNPSLSCEFTVGDDYYLCWISVQNPRGFEFTEIEGEHVTSRNASDVTDVFGFFQNTMVVPRVLCNTFENLRTIRMWESQIEEILADSFLNCRNLEVLDLQLNLIWRMDPNSFIGNRALVFLELSNNRLTSLPTNAFMNAPLEFLDLAFNFLEEFSHWSFTSLSNTLQTLDLNGNRIRQIRPDSFSNFVNLRRLILSNNGLINVHPDAFRFLNNLYDLYIANNGLRNLDPRWFEALPALEEIHINGNDLNELPEGIFRPNPRLRQLFVYENNLRALNANHFGQVQSLTHILAQDNRIRAIDPRILDRARNLYWLFLSGNVCNNENFNNVQVNRASILQQLNTCFANAGPPHLHCIYQSSDPDYICSLRIFNPFGREDFREVEGLHDVERSDFDVTALYGYNANTLNFPAIICEQFSNLREINMMTSGIEYLDSGTFASCVNIETIAFYANFIEVIPAFTFNNNPRLGFLSMQNNGLRGIDSFAFAGAALNYLDISNNPLEFFDPFWISFHGETLQSLNLMNTRLDSLEENAFEGMGNLVSLTLANNRLTNLPGSIFAHLTQLQTLILGNAQLMTLNREWFENLSALTYLNLQGNNLFDLPPNIFNSLTSLETLHIYQNHIRDIDVASFGSSANSIHTLSFQNNEVIGVDPSLLDTASNLQILYLNNNNCTGQNFYSIQENIEQVRIELDECFTNFAADFLHCNYYVLPNGGYACGLTINNPIGRDAFTVIPGDHMEGRGNEDVTQITLLNQNSRIVPGIICEQFPNLRTLIASSSEINLLTPRSFAGCSQLEAINLINNNIANIPPNTFANNSLLNYLSLSFNRIENLHPESFEGSAIAFLDLSFNQIRDFDANLFISINSTLRTLDLLDNRIERLQPDGFRNLRDLESLVLSNNPLAAGNIPGNAFIALDSLQFLTMGNTQLGRINPMWFFGLQNLNYLALYNNQIENLAAGDFNSLTNLDTLSLNNNLLWEINESHFGSMLQNIRLINVQNNVINMIDENILRSAPSLQYLLLAGNVCSDQDFSNISSNVEQVLESLFECTNNFAAESNINCQYADVRADLYGCTLESHNPRGFNGFTSIPGEHLEGRSDSNVEIVHSNLINMRTIPTIICQQFPNIMEMIFVRSNIERIDQFSFNRCQNLRYLFIMENLIRTIPDNTFINSPALIYLSMNLNRISRMGPWAFRGTSLETLDLANNAIDVFDPRTYQTINNTLRFLDLLNNRISAFPFDPFEQISLLTMLVLSGNPIRNLPYAILYPLWDLEILSISNCQLTELHHTAFFNSVNLRHLYVQNNLLPDFQDGVFHNMTSLELIYFENNQIRDLRSISFGMSIPTLRVLRGDENLINAIDPTLIDDAINLEYLVLTSNLCVDESFMNVGENLGAVREALQGCFDNFNEIEDF